MKTRLLTVLLAAAPTLAQAECHPLAGMSLCGDWAADGDGWRVTGDASLRTWWLTLPLPAAELSVSLDPPAVTGEADFEMPALGPLAGWASAELPRAQVQVGLGGGLEGVEIGGEPLALDPDRLYLVYDIDQAVSGELNGAQVSIAGGPSTKVVVAPQDPLIYLEGDIVEHLTAGLVSDGAVGVSLSGDLPWASALPLFNGQGWDTRTVSAHVLAQGNVQLGQYPVYALSQVALDLDRDDDGAFAFEAGEPASDVRLGVNGELALGWDKGPVSLTLPIGEGSLVYNGPNGRLMVHGELGLNPYAGTPLAPLFVGVQGGTLWGHYDAPDDFSVQVAIDGPVMGFASADVAMSLSPDEVTFGGQFTPVYGDLFGDQSVAFEGALAADGSFVMTGHATVNLAGFELADAALTWTNDGLSVDGVVDVPGLGEVQVAGAVETSGEFEVTGSVDLAPLGVPVSGAAVTVRHDGLTLSGAFGVPGLTAVHVAGAIDASGRFELLGQANLTVHGFALADASVRVDNDGVAIAGEIDALIAQGRVGGTYRTAEQWARLLGLSVHDFEVVRAAQRSMGVDLFPVGLRLDGAMALQVPLPTGAVSLTEGRVRVTDDSVHAIGKVSFFGNGIEVKGWVKRKGNGSLDLELSGEIDFDVTLSGTGLKGGLEVTLTENSLGGEVDAKACVDLGLWDACAGFDVGVNSSGKVVVDLPSPIPNLNFSVDKLF